LLEKGYEQPLATMKTTAGRKENPDSTKELEKESEALPPKPSPVDLRRTVAPPIDPAGGAKVLDDSLLDDDYQGVIEDNMDLGSDDDPELPKDKLQVLALASSKVEDDGRTHYYSVDSGSVVAKRPSLPSPLLKISTPQDKQSASLTESEIKNLQRDRVGSFETNQQETPSKTQKAVVTLGDQDTATLFSSYRSPGQTTIQQTLNTPLGIRSSTLKICEKCVRSRKHQGDDNGPNFDFVIYQFKCQLCKANGLSHVNLIEYLSLDYDQFIRSNNVWFENSYILAFGCLVLHSVHKMNTVFDSCLYPRAKPDEVVLEKGTKHIAAICCHGSHYVLITINIDYGVVTVDDGLEWELWEWSVHIEHLLWKYKLIRSKEQIVMGDDNVVFPKKKDKESKPGQHQFLVVKQKTIRQHDGTECGPIACMNLWRLIDPDTAPDLGGEIRGQVVDHMLHMMTNSTEHLFHTCGSDKLKNKPVHNPQHMVDLFEDKKPPPSTTKTDNKMKSREKLLSSNVLPPVNVIVSPPTIINNSTHNKTASEDLPTIFEGGTVIMQPGSGIKKLLESLREAKNAVPIENMSTTSTKSRKSNDMGAPRPMRITRSLASTPSANTRRTKMVKSNEVLTSRVKERVRNDAIAKKRQEVQAVKMKKAYTMDDKGAEVGSIVTVRVDKRDKRANNPRGILGIVHTVNSLQTITVATELGVVSMKKADVRYPPEHYSIKHNLSTLSKKLQEVRAAIINGTYVKNERVSRAEAHQQLNFVPVRKSCSCRGKCGPNCGCVRENRPCGSNCGCAKHGFKCNND
jgi:hypothetical protein